MQHLDFRCRILNYKTQEVNIVKLLDRIYDPSWDKNIDTEKSSGLIGGYQIRYDENLNKMCGEEINTFMNEVVYNVVQEYCMQEFIYKGGTDGGLPPIAIDLTDYWINIMPPGSYQRTISQHNCNLSGTFYLQAPEGSGDMYIQSPYINAIETIITTATEFIIPPIVREGWLYPSSLPHFISRNESDEDKVSISYNLKLRNK